MNYKKILIFCLFYGIKWAYGQCNLQVTLSKQRDALENTANCYGEILVVSPIGAGYEYAITDLADPNPPPLSYQSSPIFSNLIQSNFKVTVKFGTCTATATMSTHVDFNRTPVSSGLNTNGSLELLTPVGYPLNTTFTYSINGITGNFANNLSRGNYCAVITGTNGCTYNRKYSIYTDAPVSAEISNDRNLITSTQPDCIITVNSVTFEYPLSVVTLPDPQIEISFNNGSFGSSNSATFPITTTGAIPIKIRKVATGSSTSTFYGGVWLNNSNTAQLLEPQPNGILELNLVDHFAADPTGVKNSYYSFIAARDFINARAIGKCRLTIPDGFNGGTATYLIAPPQDLVRNPTNPLTLLNREDVEISNTTGSLIRTKIKYANGLKIGYEINNNQYVPNYCEQRELFTPGTFITFFDSKNCKISNIEVDGNRRNMTQLYPTIHNNNGPVYDAGNNGITVKGLSETITIDNVIMKNFHTDGIAIFPDYEILDHVPYDIRIKNSDFLYCGRTNMAWTGGKHLIVENCQFNLAGYEEELDANGNLVYSKRTDCTRLGLDIEDDDGKSLHDAIIEDGHFKNCKFMHNFGFGIHNSYAKSKDISFEDDCVFYNLSKIDPSLPSNQVPGINNNVGIHTLGEHVVFDHCKFYCQTNIQFPIPVNVPGNLGRTEIRNSDFFDNKPINNPNFPSYFKDDFSGTLVTSEANSALLENCTFNLEKETTKFANLQCQNVGDEEKYFYLKNITVDYKSIIPNTNSVRSYLQGCIFDGYLLLKNTGNANKTIYSNSIVFKGSALPSNPNNFKIDKNIYWHHQPQFFIPIQNPPNPPNPIIYLINNKFVIGRGLTSADLDGNALFENKGKLFFDNYLQPAYNSTPSSFHRPIVEIGYNSKLWSMKNSAINFGSSISGGNPGCDIKLGGKLYIGQDDWQYDGYAVFYDSKISKISLYPELYISPKSNTNTPANIDPVNGIPLVNGTSYFGSLFESEVCPTGNNPQLPMSTSTYTPFPTNCDENEALDFSLGGNVKVLDNEKFCLSDLNNNTAQDFAIEINFKQKTSGSFTGFSALFSKYLVDGNGINSGFEIGVYNPNGKIYLQMGNNNLNYSLNYYDVNVNDGACHHMVVVRKNVNGLFHFYLFLDGVAIPHVTGVSNSNDVKTQNDIYFGSRWNSTNKFGGIISRIRFWHHTMTQADMLPLYQGVLPTYISDLVADWDKSNGAATFNDDVTLPYSVSGILGTTANPGSLPSWISAQDLINRCPCVTVFLEGYYLGSKIMEHVMENQNYLPTPASDDVDDMTIELHEATAPYNLVNSKTFRLKDNGLANIGFTYNGLFYIVLKHRNSLETWSKDPVMIMPNTNYNFTDLASKAYGDNMKEVEPGVWALFSGDMNQDGYVDSFDYDLYDTDSQNNLSGLYVATDLNGDGYVDGFDYDLYDINSQNSATISRP